MASKFADLPGIDTAPDVYETEDVPSLPEASAAVPEPGLSTPGISAAHITPARAAHAFRSARWTTHTDFSGALPPSRRTAPRHRSTPESKLARIERLRAQLNTLKNGGEGDLVDLYQALDRAERKAGGTGQRARITKPEPTAQQKAWNQRTELLLRELAHTAPVPAPSNESTHPQQPPASEIQVSQVEAKITQLERYLGCGSVSLDRPSLGLAVAAGMIPALEKIEHQLALLAQPKHSDAVARRIKVLSTELDRVHEASRRTAPLGGSLGPVPAGAAVATGVARAVLAGTVQATEGAAKPLLEEADAEKAAQVCRLWRVQSTLEPILPIGSALLHRMRVLAALHDQASDFSSRLVALQQQASHLTKAQKDTRSSLTLVGEQVTALTGNMDNLVNLDERLADLSAQIGMLEIPEAAPPDETSQATEGEVVYE